MQGMTFAGRYLIGALLDQGGMGAVYRAVDLRTGGTVAVKVLHPALAADAGYVARLQREAQLAASITSSRVVRVQDLDEHGGAPFLVMEFVPGPTLADLLAEHGVLPAEQALWISREVALALEAAHRCGIVHRDLKPQNIKVADGQVKVLDFGIARADGRDGLTTAGTYLGTPEYSAPERLEEPGDIRSDIYALGVMLFEMLEGRRPFTAPTAMAVFYQHATAAPPRLSPALPAPLHALVARCLSKNPDDRYATPTDLLRALTAMAAVIRDAAPEHAGTDAAHTLSLGGDATLRPGQSFESGAAPAPLSFDDNAARAPHLPRDQVAFPAPPARDGDATLGTAAETGRATRRSVATPVPDAPTLRQGRPPRRPARWAVAAAVVVVGLGMTGTLTYRLRDGGSGVTAGAGTATTVAGTTGGRGAVPTVIAPTTDASTAVVSSTSAPGTLAVDGPPFAATLTLPAATTPIRYPFAAKAGARITLAITAVAYTGPCCMGVTLIAPSGLNLPNAASTFHQTGATIRSPVLNEDGTYQVAIDPGRVDSARMTFTVSTDVTATLTTEGLPAALRLVRPGQHGVAGFTGTAGQRISLGITDVAAGGEGCCLALTLTGPDGALVAMSDARIGTRGGALYTVAGLPATGQYQVTVNPAGAGTATLNLTLAADQEQTAAIDGPPLVVPRGRAGQQLRVTFPGTTGRRLGIDISAVSGNGEPCCAGLTLLAPDGSPVALNGHVSTDGSRIEPVALPATGPYTLLIAPGGLLVIGLTLRLASSP